MSPIAEVHDVKFHIKASHSCNSNCCIPKKRDTTDQKVKRCACTII